MELSGVSVVEEERDEPLSTDDVSELGSIFCRGRRREI